MADRWRLERGATVLDGGGVRFAVWAPNAGRVAVRVYDGEGYDDALLEARALGVHEGVVATAAAGSDYKFVLDGDADLPDPVSRHQPHGVHGPSRVVDPRGFAWTDGAWRGMPMADYVIYELHVGTFSEAGTFDGAIPYLEGLRALGVTAIELMPLAEFPGARNWGYDGVEPYAVAGAYGGPEGLRRLVDAAHAAGLAVLIDVVYNHLGPEGNYLSAYGPYFTDTYRTPWGAALNFDARDSDEVRRYFVDNALYWVTEFHADGLRLDAIHGILDRGAKHVVQEIAEAVEAQATLLGRTVVVIGESDLNDPRVVRPREQHGHGLHAQWADDFHHAVHALLTGESNGYYADFGGVAPVAAALQTPFVYDGRYSAHRRRRHGAPATGIPTDRFVVFLQNHDQVGNRANGDRLSTLVSYDQAKLAAALLLWSPYVPLLFMGEEYGETNPFLYFVSHGDEEIVEAVRAGRRAEFKAFAWGEHVPDPQSHDTFARSRLDRAKLDREPHASMYRLYRDFLRVRRTEPALRPGDAAAHVAHDPVAGWLTVELTPRAAGADLFAVFNVTASSRLVPVATTRGGRWCRLLATTDPAYAGEGAPSVCDTPRALDGRDPRITVGAWTGAIYRRSAD